MRDSPFPLSLGGAGRDQPPIQRERRIARHLATGEHDRDVRDPQVDAAPRRFAEPRRRVSLTFTPDAEHELGPLGGQHVRRHVGRAGHGGRAQEGVDLAPALREQKSANVLLPDHVLSAQRRGPGKVHVRSPAGDDVQRAHRVHLEQHDHGREIERHEDVLLDRERLVCVLDRDAFGMLDH